MLPEQRISQMSGIVAGAMHPFASYMPPWRNDAGPAVAWHVAPRTDCVLTVDVAFESNVTRALTQTRAASGLRDLQLEEITALDDATDEDGIYTAFVELVAGNVREQGLLARTWGTRYTKVRMEENRAIVHGALEVLQRLTRRDGHLRAEDREAPAFDPVSYGQEFARRLTRRLV